MIELRPVDTRKVHAAFLAAFADYSMGAPTGLTEERLFLRMKKNGVDYDLSVAAYEEGAMVGFTLIGLDAWGGRPTAYDAGTGILPGHRGQGLARRMFEHALPGLAERQVEQFVLEVLQDNEPAIRAYRKSGFETARELRSFVAPVDALSSGADPRWALRAINPDEFERVASEADWLPSFENRTSAVRAISGDVALVGAFDGEECAGAYAYSAPLRWLLTLVVRRAFRGRGAGRALLAHAAVNVPEAVTRITALNVDGADLGMQRFLSRLGFSPLVDQFEMRRPIG